ncbi:unnamed protein product [Paramecium primaurelia]|uniref:Uncharacterized protein n=1 Tax=Paramecium primaurelia TaxID=5886 RepID=A0A8S1NP79_PARPR|nr:unnamed protein product [Paramecium primaurelia]
MKYLIERNNQKNGKLLDGQTNQIRTKRIPRRPHDQMQNLIGKQNQMGNYKILRAPLIINQKIEVNEKCKQINFFNIFEKKQIFKIIRNRKNVCAVRFKQKMKLQQFQHLLQDTLSCHIFFYKSSDFPQKESYYLLQQLLKPIFVYSCQDQQRQRPTLYMAQQDILLTIAYTDKEKDIGVVRTNWSEYVMNIKGGRVYEDSSSEREFIIETNIYDERQQIIEITSQDILSHEIHMALQQETDEVDEQQRAFILKRMELISKWKEKIFSITLEEISDKQYKERDFHAPNHNISQYDLLRLYNVDMIPFQKQMLQINFAREKAIDNVGGHNKTSQTFNFLHKRKIFLQYYIRKRSNQN